jgi:type IV pilus assembly protein PilC
VTSFQYVAYNPAGEKIKGTIEAVAEKSAEELLWRMDYTVITLRKMQRRRSVAEIMPSFFGVKKRDLIIFSRQLATLIESGIPIVRSLQLLSEQVSNKSFGRVIGEMTTEIRTGTSLSEATAKHPRIFPPIYSRMIQVGERTGNISLVLRQVATHMEKEEAIVRKIRSAMAYPAFILTAAIGVVVLLVMVALPSMMGLYASFDTELPLPTRVLMAITDFTTAYRAHLVVAILAVLLFLVWFSSTGAGKRFKDLLMLRIPLIKRVTVQGGAARLSRTMSVLLRAGLALPEILDLSARTMGNSVIKDAIAEVRDEMIRGHGLSDPLSKHKVFPGMLVQMIRVGEEAGTLDDNLETMASFYEEEVDRAVAAMSSAVEPALMLFIGGVVGFVAVATIMPMYSIMGALG